ncbi:MAG: c-type cytochrome [Phycisphaeraceae bacterium]|nr:c-type cytochrome [Phycisphaeraceae bacterium]
MDHPQPPESDQHDVNRMHSPIMREHSEPADGREPMPIWLIIVFGAMLLWGGWYLGQYSGHFRGDVLDERAADRAAYPRRDLDPDLEIDPLVLGRRVYTLHCMSCHQIDGMGLEAQYPPLAGSEWVHGSPRTLARIVLHGLHGPIEVAGEVYDDQMPGHGDQLTDLRIAAVLSFIRTAWGNDAPPVDPRLVREVRLEHAGRRASWTVTELREAEATEHPAAEQTTTPPAEPEPASP